MAEDKPKATCPTEAHFVIAVRQLFLVETWLEEHDKKCIFSNPDRCGAIGGRMTYSFTPVGIGVITKARCVCGEELDVTDYDSW